MGLEIRLLLKMIVHSAVMYINSAHKSNHVTYGAKGLGQGTSPCTESAKSARSRARNQNMSKTTYSRTSRTQGARGVSAPYRLPDDLTQGQRSSVQDQSGGASSAADPRVAGQSTSDPRSLQRYLIKPIVIL